MATTYWDAYFFSWAPWSSIPYYTWFEVTPADQVMQEMHRWWYWPSGTYYFYKIPEGGGHRRQVAFQTPVDVELWGYGGHTKLKANTTYVLTYPGDTPNYGMPSGTLTISGPCGNWQSNLYLVTISIRNQTGEICAAVQGSRSLLGGIKAAIAHTPELDNSIAATIAGNPELSVPLIASIRGEAEIAGSEKVAIRGNPELDGAISATIGQDFDMIQPLKAAIRGNPLIYNIYRAAIKGEAELTGTLKVFIVKDREDEIFSELVGKIPQEFGITSERNGPSKARNWRTQPLS